MPIKSKIIGDRVILESVTEVFDSVDSSIIVPDVAKETGAHLVIAGLGTAKTIPPELKVGMRVWAHPKDARRFTMEGKDFISVKSNAILAYQE